MSETAHTRRDLLMLLTAAAGISTVPPLAAALQAPAGPHPALRFLIFNHSVAARIGAAYRRAHPQDDGMRHLLQTIRQSAQAQVPLRETLLAAVERDFDTGNSLQIEGWILSRTEVRLCALFA